MQMAQVPQRLFIFVTHTPGKVRIVQPLVPRGLRHVLQHAQPPLNRLLALRRHLSPLRQYIVLDVLALLRRQMPPRLFFRPLIRPLLRAHAVPLLKLPANVVLLLRRQILERPAVPQHALALLRRNIPHAVHPRPRRSHSQLLPRRQVPVRIPATPRFRVALRFVRWRIRWPVGIRFVLVPGLLALLLPLRFRRLRGFGILLPHKRTPRPLRHTRVRRSGGKPQRQHTSSELDPKSHQFTSADWFRPPAPAAANPSTDQNCSPRRDRPTPADHASSAYPLPARSVPRAALPKRSCSSPAKPSPAAASTPQTPRAATAQTTPTS